MIDFKKEVQKYQPAKVIEELQEGISLNEIKDINELLQYIANLTRKVENTGKE